jgi:hypothetical protein
LELNGRPRTNIDGPVEDIDRSKPPQDGCTPWPHRLLQGGDGVGLQHIITVEEKDEFTRSGSQSVIAGLSRTAGGRPKNYVNPRSSAGYFSNNLRRHIGRPVIDNDDLLDLGLKG